MIVNPWSPDSLSDQERMELDGTIAVGGLPYEADEHERTVQLSRERARSDLTAAGIAPAGLG